MTLVVLAALGAAWLVYFVLWLRERRISPTRRHTSMHSFSSALGALARPVPDPRGRSRARNYREQALGNQAAGTGEWFDAPRSPVEATRRRRLVISALVVVAVASLISVPGGGMIALVFHLLADLALAAAVGAVAMRGRTAARSDSNVRELYPRQAASSDGVVVPLRRVADG